MAQKVVSGIGCHLELGKALKTLGIRKPLLVHDAAFPQLRLREVVDALPMESVPFHGFSSNPRYQEAAEGTALFRAEGCDGILAIGGGSALDVAKCIKLFSAMRGGESYLLQPFRDSGVPLIAVPTTAGTGSEATRFAVIYDRGEKQSIADESLLPDIALLDGIVLETLPLFQKKCTLMDALCQAIESWWSIHATDESIAYAQEAIAGITKDMDVYLSGWDEQAAQRILEAAHAAGKAINRTQTTAAHAMSYKLTSLYSLPHGYAVALCLPKLWAYMLHEPEHCVHPKGWGGLLDVFAKIAQSMHQPDAESAIEYFESLLKALGLSRPHTANAEELNILADSVNPLRLGNNPVSVTRQALLALYREIVVVETV